MKPLLFRLGVKTDFLKLLCGLFNDSIVRWKKIFAVTSKYTRNSMSELLDINKNTHSEGTGIAKMVMSPKHSLKMSKVCIRGQGRVPPLKHVMEGLRK